MNPHLSLLYSELNPVPPRSLFPPVVIVLSKSAFATLPSSSEFSLTGLNGLMYEKHLEWYLAHSPSFIMNFAAFSISFPTDGNKDTSLLLRSKKQLQTWVTAPWPLPPSLSKLFFPLPFRPTTSSSPCPRVEGSCFLSQHRLGVFTYLVL